MRIYIDNDFKCYTSDYDGSLREFETPLFDGKCNTFIEGYRYIPSGESWERSDGVVFTGEMIAPLKGYGELDDAQRKYEREKLAEYEALIDELFAEVSAE